MIDNQFQIERWETLISALNPLEFLSFYDNGMDGLILSVGSTQGSADGSHLLRFQITFTQAVAYRKEPIISTFMSEEERQSIFGNTIVIPSSQWLSDIQMENPFLEMEYAGLTHRLIRTVSQTIEVISAKAPQFQRVV